jgi:hypothetical protein
MEQPKLIREVDSEEFMESSLEEETELFERRETKDKEKVLLG